MKIFLIRHGNAHIVDNDEPLTERGHIEAKAVCKELEKYPIKKVFSSDLTRTKQTCSYLVGHKIEYSDKIREIYRVLVGGTSKPGTSPNREENDKKRADEFWEYLMTLDENVALFTHGNLIKYYLMKCLNLPKEGVFDNILISNTSITILEKMENDVRINGVNKLSHSPYANEAYDDVEAVTDYLP